MPKLASVRWLIAICCTCTVGSLVIAGQSAQYSLEGRLAAFGAFSVGFAAFESDLASRVWEMHVVSLVMGLSFAVGAAVNGCWLATIVAVFVWSFGVGWSQFWGPLTAFASAQATVALLFGALQNQSPNHALHPAVSIFVGGELQIAVVMIPLVRKWASILSALPAVRLAFVLPEDVTTHSSALFRAFAVSASVTIAALMAGMTINPFRFWVPVTAVLVIRASRIETLQRMRDRAGGTAIGVLLIIGALRLLPSNPAYLILLSILCCLLSYVFVQLNYAFYCVFLTGYVLVGLGGGSKAGLDNAFYRIAYTLLGVLLSWIAVILMGRLGISRGTNDGHSSLRDRKQSQ